MATHAEEAAYCTRRVARSTALARASTDRCARAAHAGMAAAYGAQLAALTRAGAPAIVPVASAPAAGRRSLFRWDNEGGAMAPDPSAPVPRPAAAEPAGLATRVTALENVIVAMLAGGPGDQRAVIHDMALFVRPLPTPTGDGATIDVAALMDRLAHRAASFARAPGEGSQASD